MCSACTTPIDPLTSQLLAYRIGNTDVFAVPVPTQNLLATNPPLINVRPTRPSDSLSPGQFYSIRLGDSTGGNDYRTNIATCSGEQTFCGSCYVTEPGNMIGPTRQGVDDLIPDPPDNFFVLADGRWCFGASSTDCETTGSPQLVIAPIWDICNTPGVGACPAEDFCADADSDGFPDGKFSGTPSLRIIAYATLFVTGWSGTDLQARLLDVKPCVGGPATDDDGNLQTGPLATPLRLVKAP
jgi:hypothetical protein